MPDALPGLVICELCFRAGPRSEEIFALPEELEAAATEAGWAFQGGWVCRECLAPAAGRE